MRGCPSAALIAGLPAGLDRTLLRLLSYHVGRANAASRADLLTQLQRFALDEPALRARVQQLRRQGFLIGSARGERGGYYLVATPAEFRELLQREYLGPIQELSEVVARLRQSAARLFPAGDSE